VARAEHFRAVGLETATMVAGDDVAVVVERLHAAYARARSRPAGPRAWTVEAPEDPEDPLVMGLDDRLDLRDQLAARHDEGLRGG